MMAGGTGKGIQDHDADHEEDDVEESTGDATMIRRHSLHNLPISNLFAQAVSDVKSSLEEMGSVDGDDVQLRPHARRSHSLVSVFDDAAAVERYNATKNLLLAASSPPVPAGDGSVSTTSTGQSGVSDGNRNQNTAEGSHVGGANSDGFTSSCAFRNYMILEIRSLTTPSCAKNLEECLRSVEGVTDVSVNYFTSRIRLILRDPSTAGRRATVVPDDGQQAERGHALGDRSDKGTSAHFHKQLVRYRSQVSMSGADAEEFSEVGNVDDELEELVLNPIVTGSAMEEDVPPSRGEEGEARENKDDDSKYSSGDVHATMERCVDVISRLGYDWALLTPLPTSDETPADDFDDDDIHAPLKEVGENMEWSNREDIQRWGTMFVLSTVAAIAVFGLGLSVSRKKEMRDNENVQSEGRVGHSCWEEWIIVALATFLQVVACGPFYCAAYRHAKMNWFVGTDFLIAVSTTLVYAYSLVVLGLDHFGGNDWNAPLLSTMLPTLPPTATLPRMTFETAVGILMICSGAKWIESILKRYHNQPVRHLMALQPEMAWRVELSHEDMIQLLEDLEHNHHQEGGVGSGRRLTPDDKLYAIPKQEIPVGEVKVGDHLLVPPGTAVPTDSILKFHSQWLNADSAIYVDESSLTGDPFPIPKYKDDVVLGGFCLSPIPYTLLVEVTMVGESTVLSHVIRAIEEQADCLKSSMQRLTETLAYRFFVPMVWAYGMFQFGLWFVLSEEDLIADRFFLAFMTVISVLLVGCPCAYFLGATSAQMVGTSVAAENGIHLRGGWHTVEAARRIDTVVFDLETLSDGNSACKEYVPFLTPSFQGDGMLRNFPTAIGDMKFVPLWLASCSEFLALHTGQHHSTTGHAIIDAARDLWALEDEEDITCSQEGVVTTGCRVSPGLGTECIVEKEGWGRRCIRVGTWDWATEKVASSADTTQNPGDDKAAIEEVMASVDSVELDMKVRQLHSSGLVVVYISSISACHVAEVNSDDNREDDGSPLTRSIIGVLGIMESVHAQARSTVLALQGMGVEVWLCTSEQAESAKKMSETTGISASYVCAGFNHQQKADLLSRLRKRAYFRAGKTNKARGRITKAKPGAVAMVGSCLTQATALSMADVGISFGGGSAQAPEEVSNVVLVRESLHDIVVTIHLSKLIYRRIQTNSALAAWYNALAPSVVVFLPVLDRWMPPSLAALAMSVSCIVLMGSSLLLGMYCKPEIGEDGQFHEAKFMDLPVVQDFLHKIGVARQACGGDKSAAPGGEDDGDAFLPVNDDTPTAYRAGSMGSGMGSTMV